MKKPMTLAEYGKALSELPPAYEDLWWDNVSIKEYKGDLIIACSDFPAIVWRGEAWEDLSGYEYL